MNTENTLSVVIDVIELDTIIAMLKDLKGRLEKDLKTAEDKNLLLVQYKVAGNFINDLAEKKKKMWENHWKVTEHAK